MSLQKKKILLLIFTILGYITQVPEIPSEPTLIGLPEYLASIPIQSAQELDALNTSIMPERNLRDTFRESLDTTDISEVLSPINSIFGSTSKSRDRSLQSDGNPVFDGTFHDGNVNYFQIVLADFNSNMERLHEANAFIREWMLINPDTETLSVQHLNIENTAVMNRYVATYVNTQKDINKLYYIDVDFSDGKSDRSRVSRIRTVDYIHNLGSSDSYLRNYEFTLEEDCRTIQQAQHNPQEIQCQPFLTADHFVVPHVYNVVMTYRQHRKRIRRRGRFFVRSRVVGPDTAPLIPAPVTLPTSRDIIHMIRDRVRSTPFFQNKEIVLEELSEPEMVQRITGYTNQIAQWENLNRQRLRTAENTYHVNLRRELRRDRVNKQNDNRNFENTFAIMRRAANLVNAFNIRGVIRRTARRLEDRQTIWAQREKSRYYQREIALVGLMEKLDHMRYLADKHLDDNFDHYYSPEYFKK